MQIPEDEWILGTYYTFSKRDLEIINKRRREENRLGFAVQLAVLRYPGWPYTHIKKKFHSDVPNKWESFVIYEHDFLLKSRSP